MSDIEREVFEADLLIVGAGPGGLAAAIRYCRLLLDAKERGEDLGEPTVLILEKAAEVGFHSCSGAVMDPRSIRELIPDYVERGCPIEADVKDDEVWLLHESEHVKAPFVPPPLRNHGCHIISLGRLTAWMAEYLLELAEELEGFADVFLMTETAGASLLWDEERVIGVRTGDKGLDKNGERKANYEPGSDVMAKVTVLSEGARGSLAKTLIAKLGLDEDSNPQIYGLGIKELWQLPTGSVDPGKVIHTLGWPLGDQTFGGAFIYTMADDIVDIGLVVGLDYKDPNLEPHALFQQLKTHPSIRKLLAGGKMIQYGAKALPEGGFHCIPRTYADGVLLIGDSASFLNPMRLKGIHTAMKTGMLAAETAFAAVKKGDTSADELALFQTAVNGSWVYEELRFSRNFHAGFEHGMVGGLLNSGVLMMTNGMGLFGSGEGKAGHEQMQTVDAYVDGHDLPEERRHFTRPKYDGELTFDKLTNVYHSGTKHEEDQPCHLQVADTELCVTRCAEEYNNPCTRFCPAQVYNIVDDASHDTGKRLQIDFSNCVHCKTCDIMDPYEVITWVTPEGGDGPRYDRL